MENSKERLQELQSLQQQIISFIETHTANEREDELVIALRTAVANLNEAKTIVLDRAIAAGTMSMYQHGKATQNTPKVDAKTI